MEQIRRFNLIKITLGILLLSLVVYKAVVTSMTHDESASFIYFNQRNIVFDLFDSTKWNNANNHWLNTIAFQISSRIFGHAEWSIRLFNILAFVLYLWTSYKLSNLMKTKSANLLTFLLLVGNPYFLDFFSVARGYGVSMSFSLFSFYHFLQFYSGLRIKHLITGLLVLLLSTLSLFSSVIFFPVYLGSIFFLLIWIKKIPLTRLITPLLIASGFGLITAVLIWVPFHRLSSNAEFKWGAKTLYECFQSLAFHCNYSNKLIPNYHFVLAFCVFVTILLLGLNLKDFFSKNLSKPHLVKAPALIAFLLLILTMVFTKYALGTYYPVDRKTIIFIPLIALVVGSLFDHHSQVKNVTSYLLSAAITIHLALVFRPNTIREWWYDRDTKSFALLINQDSEGRNSSVGCHWMFHPTLSFYSQTQFTNLKIEPYSKRIKTEDTHDYFVCFDADYNSLKSNYTQLHRNKTGRMVLKRKK